MPYCAKCGKKVSKSRLTYDGNCYDCHFSKSDDYFVEHNVKKHNPAYGKLKLTKFSAMCIASFIVAIVPMSNWHIVTGYFFNKRSQEILDDESTNNNNINKGFDYIAPIKYEPTPAIKDAQVDSTRKPNFNQEKYNVFAERFFLINKATENYKHDYDRYAEYLVRELSLYVGNYDYAVEYGFYDIVDDCIIANASMLIAIGYSPRYNLMINYSNESGKYDFYPVDYELRDHDVMRAIDEIGSLYNKFGKDKHVAHSNCERTKAIGLHIDLGLQLEDVQFNNYYGSTRFTAKIANTSNNTYARVKVHVTYLDDNANKLGCVMHMMTAPLIPESSRPLLIETDNMPSAQRAAYHIVYD